MLMLFNYRSEAMMQLSDNICTALQLTNFWQDISVDLQKDRIYLPLEDMEGFDYSQQDLLNRRYDDRFRNLMAFEVRRTAELFVGGKLLLSMVGKDLSLELRLIWNGGTSILQKIHEQEYNVLKIRPVLSLMDKLGLLFRSFIL
jgi:phytoene/squalene synthetase